MQAHVIKSFRVQLGQKSLNTPLLWSRSWFLHVCMCISAVQLEFTFRLRPFDTDDYHIVLSGSCHVRSSTGHTRGLISSSHGNWWVMFFLGPTGPESSVSVSQRRDSVCVNRIMRNIVDLCVCLGLGLCLIDEIWANTPRWGEFYRSDTLVYFVCEEFPQLNATLQHNQQQRPIGNT